MSLKTGTFVSVILVVHDHADVITEFLDSLMALLAGHYDDYEVVALDDGSEDGSAGLLAAALKRYEGLRVLTLAQHYGFEAAASVGYDTVVGDVIVTMSPGDDPVELLPKAVEMARQGHGLVIGVKPAQDLTPSRRLMRRVFHSLCRYGAGFTVPERTTGFISVARSTLNTINRFEDRHRILRLYPLLKGFRVEYLPYRQTERARTRHRPLLESFWLAADILTSNSLRPLRLAGAAALLFSGFNLLYMGYIVAIYLFKPHVAEGWVTTSLQNSVAFFVFSLVLAVFGEYLGRSLLGSHGPSKVLLLSEQASNVLIPNRGSRLNVVTDPLDED